MKTVSAKFIVTSMVITFLSTCTSQITRPGNETTAGEGNPAALIDPVTGAKLVSIEVTPNNQTIFKGETLQFIAMGSYSNNTTNDITSSVVWSSSDITVANINANASVAGLGAGSSDIKATLGTISGSANLTVKMQMVYLPNYGSGDITMYEINSNTGVLSLRGHVAAGSAPYGIAVHPNNKYVYVSSSTNGTPQIFVYEIDQHTGILTQLGTTVVTTLENEYLAIHPSGKFLYSLAPTSNKVSLYLISAEGLLTFVNSYSTGNRPFKIAFHTSGMVAYVTNFLSNNVFIYKVNQTTGALGYVNQTAVTKPTGIVVNPTDNVLYVASNMLNNIHVFDLDINGLIVSLTATPTPTVQGPMNLAISNHILLVSGFLDSKIGQHKIVGQNISTLGPTISTGTSPVGLVSDSREKFWYSANSGSNNISMYKSAENVGDLSFIDPNQNNIATPGSSPYYIDTATIPAQ